MTGLVAVAFPALTSVLNAGAVLNMATRRTFQRDFIQMARSVETQFIVLRTTVTVLLHDALTPAEIQELVSDRASPLWTAPKVEVALKQRLGDRGYEVFIEGFSSLLGTLESLENSIRIISEAPTSNVFLSRQAFKWAWSHRRASQALADLTRRNHDLEAIAQTYHSRQSIEAIQNINDALENIHSVRRVAENMEAIATGQVTISTDNKGDEYSLYSVKTEVSIWYCHQSHR